MHTSNILDNGAYAFFASACNDPTTVINAEDNWWGVTDSAGIEALVYHNPDYTSSPTVDFIPCALSPSCTCPNQADFDTDGFHTALDLGHMIDILFAGHIDTQDPQCLGPRADLDCDGFSTALDLGRLIDYLFAGAPGPCNPCSL